jgi:hypothetical protein
MSGCSAATKSRKPFFHAARMPLMFQEMSFIPHTLPCPTARALDRLRAPA